MQLPEHRGIHESVHTELREPSTVCNKDHSTGLIPSRKRVKVFSLKIQLNSLRKKDLKVSARSHNSKAVSSQWTPAASMELYRTSLLN